MTLRVLLAVCLLPLLAVSLLAQSQQPIFPIVGTYQPAPPSGVTGDFNGDGLIDTVTASSQGIVVSLNQDPSNPPILVTTNFQCGTPGTLQPADINKDGKLDIALTCGGAYVVVLIGNGDGSFQTPAYYGVNGVAQFPPPVDLNGDGYPDIVVTARIANTSNYAIQILLNKGSASPGVLSDPVSYAFPSGNASYSADIVNFGDFNGDSKVDILAGDSAVLFLGNGDGTLQQGQVETQVCVDSVSHFSYAIGDFNNDGISDLACTTNIAKAPATLSSLQMLLGSPSGQFQVGPILSLPILSPPLVGGTRYYGLAPIGKNGDNNLDLALAGDNTTILLGDGQGGFTFGNSYAISGAYAAAPDSNGKVNLLADVGNGQQLVIASNGDGTFQWLPSYPVGQYGFAIADVNNDGLTDILSVDLNGNLKTQLSRGNGTFSTSSSIPGPPGPPIQSGSVIYWPDDLLFTGDLNGDGKADVIAFYRGKDGAHGGGFTLTARLYSYLGNGDGSFQPKVAGTDLGVYEVRNAVLGDFNGDGKLDMVFVYWTPAAGTSAGLVLVPGNGDGTFGTPVTFSTGNILSNPPLAGGLLTADLNGDNKPDLIWNGSVYLGKGDGTFQQTPLGVSGAPQLVADLNGDGKVDLITNSTGSQIYAGNGDGTFQASPFYTFPFSTTAYASVLVGDVDGDGNTDLLSIDPTTQNTLPISPYRVSVLLGTGQGNFTLDTNTYSYPTGTVYWTGSPIQNLGALARLNQQALPGNSKQDLIAYTNAGATPLLNQLNPAPGAAQPVPSRTTLAASATSVGTNQQLTLTATVTGITPTGNVTFRSGTTTLGTSAITNGTATLTTSFAALGSYSVTASYAGDTNNNASTSSAVAITVAPTATTTALSASSTTANHGQAITYTATVTGNNPTGTVTFKSGPTTLGTGNVTNGVATLSASFATAGSYSVTASYSGDTNNNASASSAVSITVTATATTTALSASSSNANQSQAITYTATVTGSSPTGTVTFKSGSTTLGTGNLTNGVATLSASFATAGTYSVTASYSGDTNNNASTSSAVSITVVAPDFTLTTNPASATVKAGQTATFTVNMTTVGGYSGTVNLSCGSLPAGAACNFSNKSLSGSSTSTTLTITTTAPTTSMLERPGSSSARIAVWAVLLGLCLSPKRVLRSRKHLARIMAALLLTMGSVLYLSGCGGSSSSTTNPGTPTGTQTITVSGADSASGPSHNLNLQLIVQ